MRTALGFSLVFAAMLFGVGCAAETAEPAPPPSTPASEVEQPTSSPEQPAITASGVEADATLYQTVRVSKKLHEQALKGANYVLTTSWTYTCPVTPPTDASRDVKLADLEVTPDADPDYVVTTIKLKVATATKVMKAGAKIDLVK